MPPAPAHSAPCARPPAVLSLAAAGLCALSGFAAAQTKPPQTEAQSYQKVVRPLLEKYCWDCHGDGAKKGDLALDSYPNAEAILANRKVWEGVQFHLENWMMPPQKKTQPEPAERDTLVRFIDTLLNPYDPANPDPGRVTIRRLNRVEYNNTIRDLLGVSLRPADEFPQDDTGYGFDTIGDVLALPPILMERYVSAAQKVLDAAFESSLAGPGKWKFGPGDMRSPGGAGTRGDSAFVLTTSGIAGVQQDIPESGEYVLRVKVWATQAGPERAKAEWRVEGAQVGAVVDVSGTKDRPQTMEVKARLEQGRRRIGVGFLNDFYDPSAADPERRDRNLMIVSMEIEGPAKRQEETTAGRIFGAGMQLGETDAGARAILQNFANRAFRRTAVPAEVDRLMGIYQLARKKGEDFREALKLGMKAALVSPYFLFRVEWQPEADNAEKIHDISEFALASRLSYFLWSSMPDDELLSQAFRGELRKNLRPQVQRMLKDPKGRALAENFAGQWLEIRSVDVVQPDAKQFRFPQQLRESMRRETEEFFLHIQRENRSVMEFISADYTFLNEVLARHYGIPGVFGMHLRKTQLPPESHRRGVLTQGAILTLTSDPTRTSPVKRGKWVVENILGITPPPPPPNVPPLDDDKQKTAPTGTVRQRFEQHRNNPLCASCHALLDPMGFGLEQFDAIGAFRQFEQGQPVDSTGMLASGQKFSNAVELSDIIARDKREQFLRCLVRKMLTYALGRGMEAYDKPAVEGIVARMLKENTSFESLVLGVVESVPFQKRRGDPNRQSAPAPAEKRS
jgi:mono/diheme cytochrome c family protein